MEKAYHHIWVIAMAMGILTGCASHKLARKEKISFSPQPYQVIVDSSNQAHINLMFCIPKHYFSKRSRLFIVPQLMNADTIVKAYTPLVLDAPIFSKKMERKRELTQYQDPYYGIRRSLSADYTGTQGYTKRKHRGCYIRRRMRCLHRN